MRTKLGYEIETGKEVFIRPSHLIVTGITQLSGKTTTLEALITRSGLKAIVFKTKIGEKSFNQGTEVTPFFKDRSDYEFVKSLIEAYSKEKLFMEKGTLMRLCKGTTNLIDIKKRIDDELATGKLRGLNQEIYTRLQHYLENLIPQIQYASFSKTLNIYAGINIMNLERFSEEAQSLIMQSVADEVLKDFKDTIIVIPEAWKFLPQKYNNPCKRVIEAFIRQGATNNNYIWIDSQDMAGVDKSPLKQISTWILGYQAERNEVKHTLDQISLPNKLKPKEDDIMTLKIGHFFLSTNEGMSKVYVQPSWLDDDKASAIAKGTLNLSEIKPPSNLIPYSVIRKKDEIKSFSDNLENKNLTKDIIELRQDFFNKIQELQDGNNNIYAELHSLQSKINSIDIDEIVSKVLQKIPISKSTPQLLDKDSIIKEVIAKIPKNIGSVTYEIAPIEMLKKKFLEEAKNTIISEIKDLSTNAHRTLKYLESRGVGCTISEICIKGFMYKGDGGSYNKNVNDSVKELVSINVAKKETNGKCFGLLKNRISNLLSVHDAKETEIEQVYNHIIVEIIK